MNLKAVILDEDRQGVDKAKEVERRLMDLKIEQIRHEFKPILDELRINLEGQLPRNMFKRKISIQDTLTRRAVEAGKHSESQKQRESINNFLETLEVQNEFYEVANKINLPLLQG